MEKVNLCTKCINWDHRPEGNPGERMGYCLSRKRMVGPHYECEFYQLKTPERMAVMNRKLYGSTDDYGAEDMEF